MDIRRATVADAAALTALRLQFLREINAGDEPAGLPAATEQYFARALADGSFVAWVAVEGDTVAATSGLSFQELAPNWSNPTGKVGYILNMYTEPARRGQGLASALFAHLLEEARSRGCGKVALHATAEGRRVYGKFGFASKGDEMTLYLIQSN